MSYSSPIEIVDRMTSQLEEDVIKVVLSYDINVDKDELIKALAYDREQYEKGYADGQRAGERTAKPRKRTYDLMRCECGMPVSWNYDYCPGCGARLEWE